MNIKRAGGRILEGLFNTAPWALAVIVIAGITHLASILAMPRLAPKDAFARMTTLAPALNRTTLIQRAGPNDLTSPFDDPALAQGACRYDLSLGAVRIRANLAQESLMLMSFHSRFGDIFYSMTDRSATRGRLDVLLLTQQQLDDVEAEDSEDELPQELRIVAPTREGFLLFRALAELPGDEDDARRRVMSIACGLDKEMKN
jgi:uncharacterized membrane protein